MEHPVVELWVDDHPEYKPGVVHAHLGNARFPIDPRLGDFLVVGDDENTSALAEVLTRSESGALRVRTLPGAASSHAELHSRRQPGATL